MAASNKSVEQLFKVTTHYVPLNRWQQLADELKTIPGNKSFRETITKLIAYLEERVCNGNKT